MSRLDLATLTDQLIERDYELLENVEKYRLLTSKHLQRLHFNPAHPSQLAAARACHRTLVRLRELGVLKALQRRIGGARSGSAGFVWYLGPAGERLLRNLHPDAKRGRRNYREPSRHFVDHTLAVAELAVQTIEVARSGVIEVLQIEAEPSSWQQSVSRFGTVQTLKPDLRLVTASGEYEHHWFIEVDMASEHLPVIVRQCIAYHAHRATGRYQAEHNLYPAVVWVVPAEHRRRQLQAGIAAEKQLDARLFTIVTPSQVTDLLRAGAQDFNNQRGRQEGGTPS